MLNRHVRKTLVYLTMPLWLDPLGWWLAYQPWALISHLGMFLLFGETIFALGVLAAGAMLICAPFLALLSAYRRRALIAIGCAFLFLISFLGGLLIGHRVWRNGVEKVIARGEPLVVATNQFIASNGHPPTSLEELQPNYLSTIPTTGIGAFPEFSYVAGKPDEYDGNPLVLRAVPPSPPMGFDSLFFFPLQNYPVVGYGGGIERINRWGYVHE